MRGFKYVWLVVGLLVAITAFQLYSRNARRRALREMQQKIENLGFKPGDRYCYAASASRDSNGYWPTSYSVFEELMESLRAHDPWAPRDLLSNSVHIDQGYEILILDTRWSSPIYTKGRIASVPPGSLYKAVGEVIYTLPLSKFWAPCR
jgi:hypothetical protein